MTDPLPSDPGVGEPPVGAALATLDQLPDGQARLVLPPGVESVAAGHWPGVVLVREGAAVRAFLNRCPHFRVPLAARPAQLIVRPGEALVCNVHYSRFHWRDGRCVSGDCQPGDALQPVAVSVDAAGIVRLAGPADLAVG